MASFTLNIMIDPLQVQSLKENGFTLCIAKASARADESQSSVVWYGGDFLSSNTFKWQDNYQVFGASAYEVGAFVTVQTNMVPIGYGQTVTLDANGVLDPPQGPINTSGSFRFTNNWDPIHIGLTSSLVNSGSGSSELPFFVSTVAVPTGSNTGLIPVEKVFVWFQINGRSGTMIDGVNGPSMLVDFSGNSPISQTISYSEDGQWEYGPLLEGGSGGDMESSANGSRAC